MSEYVAHTETNEETGVRLRIIADSDLQNPVDEDDAVILAIFARNKINPAERHGIATVEQGQAFEAANQGDESEYAVFPLFAYEHGNVMYRPSAGGNPFSCPWDSGRAGFVAMKRADVGGDLFKAAESTCQVYTDWANGNGFGYVVEDAHGSELDSCWGYIGDWDSEHLMEDARGAFDAYIAEAKQAKADEAARVAAIKAAENNQGDGV